MEELTTVILSGITWDAIKKGFNISANYLKNKLSNWFIDDDKLEKISTYIKNIPDAYCISEGMIKEYLNLNKELIDILKETKQNNFNFSQNIQGENSGIANEYNLGTINNYRNENIKIGTNEETIYFKRLEKYLKKLQEDEENFKYKGKMEKTYECLQDLFLLSLKKIEYIKDEHERNCYLFSDNENFEIEEKIRKIFDLVDEYNSYNRNKKELTNKATNQMDEIGIKIMEFYDFYVQLIRKKLKIALYL